MDFKSMDIGTIITGVGSDGVRYLEAFLKEYTTLFSEKVNPGCNKCLTQYLTRYKNHFNAMANTSEYRLHAKYENIPLEFGSPVLVNNGNITDEYAQKLLKHKDGERYFASMPDPAQTKAKTDNKKTDDKAKKDEAPVTKESLEANLKAAQDHLKSLGEKPHHATLGKANKDVEAAKLALANFTADENLEKTSGTLEVVVTQSDIDRVPELKDAGIEVGATVLVNTKAFQEAGEITLDNIVIKD